MTMKFAEDTCRFANEISSRTIFAGIGITDRETGMKEIGSRFVPPHNKIS